MHQRDIDELKVMFEKVDTSLRDIKTSRDSGLLAIRRDVAILTAAAQVMHKVVDAELISRGRAGTFGKYLKGDMPAFPEKRTMGEIFHNLKADGSMAIFVILIMRELFHS